MPDRSDRYQLPSWPKTQFDRDLWNEVFGDIAERLEDREGLEASFELLQAQGIQASLDYIQATVAPQIATLQLSIDLAQDQIDKIVIDGISPNSAKLGGQLPAYYATAQAFTDGLAGKVSTSRKVAGKELSADVTLEKADVGLDNVDNTRDADKPISTPQADALAKRLRLDAGQENTSAQKRQGRANLNASHHMRFVQGLTLSNGPASLVNLVDIAPGAAQNGAGLHVANTAVLTKNITGAWVAGNGGGGMDTGVRGPSQTYHIHAIRKQTDGSFDAVFSLSATAPVVPAGYDLIERIGAVLTDAGNAIKQFVQAGNRFTWNGPYTQDFVVTGSNVPRHLFQFSAVPRGVPVIARMRFIVNAPSGGAGAIVFWDGDVTSASAPFGAPLVYNSAAAMNTQVPAEIKTSPLAQAYLELSAVAGTSVGMDVSGWDDFTIPRIGA